MACRKPSMAGRPNSESCSFFLASLALFWYTKDIDQPLSRTKSQSLSIRAHNIENSSENSSQSLLLAKFSSSPSQHSSINIDNSLINFRFITNAFQRQYFRSLTFSRSSRPFRFFNALLLILVSNCNVNILSLHFSRTTTFLAILKFSR